MTADEKSLSKWQKYRSKHRPYVTKVCAKCGEQFKPSNGPQKRCEECRNLTCRHCGIRFIPLGNRFTQTFCSRRCAALGNPETTDRINQHRGRKPRTYAKRRDKHGSAEDREWRTAVFERDGYTCQECGDKGGRLQADHIKPFSTHPELRHVLSNGRTLCVPCHQKTPTYGWRGYWAKVRAAKRLDQLVLPLEAS